jgi:hypothetical protein
MSDPPAVIVHGLYDAVQALQPRRPVTLLSAAGAALFMGPALWRSLMREARAAHPDVNAPDILDCADATGLALAALRLGQRDLVLWPSAPGRAGFVSAACLLGAAVRAAPPPALDMRDPKAHRQLPRWLGTLDDSFTRLG